MKQAGTSARRVLSDHGLAAATGYAITFGRTR
jgi:hypothetical protein